MLDALLGQTDKVQLALWTGTSLLAAVALAYLPMIWNNFVHYLAFFMDHESFYRKASMEKRRVLPFKAPWPGSFPTQASVFKAGGASN
jgi:hypothetical protein